MSALGDQMSAATSTEGQLLQTGDEEAGAAGTPAVPSGPGAATRRDWLTENFAALQDSNLFVEQLGLPLKQYREF